MTKKPIPVITSFGGVNASGRSSDHVGYQNTVFDSLSKEDQTKVLKDLAVMQGLIKASGNSWSKDSEKIENAVDLYDLHKSTEFKSEFLIFSAISETDNEKILDIKFTLQITHQVAIKLYQEICTSKPLQELLLLRKALYL